MKNVDKMVRSGSLGQVVVVALVSKAIAGDRMSEFLHFFLV
jgi:hypothetical protein